MEELRGVLAVVRHGDRTPKQKMKMTVTQARPLRGISVWPENACRFRQTWPSGPRRWVQVFRSFLC